MVRVLSIKRCAERDKSETFHGARITTRQESRCKPAPTAPNTPLQACSNRTPVGKTAKTRGKPAPYTKGHMHNKVYSRNRGNHAEARIRTGNPYAHREGETAKEHRAGEQLEECTHAFQDKLLGTRVRTCSQSSAVVQWYSGKGKGAKTNRAKNMENPASLACARTTFLPLLRPLGPAAPRYPRL